MTGSQLSGFPKCNEALPAGTPEETYYFYQFMPIIVREGAKHREVGIPIEVANPKYVSYIKKRYAGSADTVLAQIRKDVAPFVTDWSNAAVETPQAPEEVLIADVPALLVSGELVHAGTTYDISGLDEVLGSLRVREPVIARLTAGSVAKELKLVPLADSKCELPERVALRSAALPGLVRGERLVLPGVGAVDIALSSEAAEKATRQGFVAVNATIGGQTKEVLIELAEARGADTLAVTATASDRGKVAGSTTSHLQPAGPPAPAFDFLNPSFVLYTPIRQRWTSKGYQRGALINTFSLAPQEQVTIEVFSWDRRKTSSEYTASRETEASTESSFSRKASSEVVDSASNSNGWKLGVQAGFQVPQIGLNVGADFSIDNRNENSQTATLGTIAEGVEKVATTLKSSVQTKVTEAREYGSEERITRKFQNPNLGRVLHFDCFEVLHDYSVTTEYRFEDARLCLLVPSVDFLYAIKDPSTQRRAAALLGLEGLLFDAVPERLRSGFESARLYLAWDRLCQFSCETPCQCAPPAPNGKGGQGPAAAGNPYEPDLLVAIAAVKASINRLRQATGQPLARVMGIPADPPGYLARSDEDKLARRADFHAYLFRSIVLEDALASFWGGCIAFSANATIQSVPMLMDRLTPSIANLLNPAFAFGSLGTAVIRHFLDAVTDFGLNLPFMLFYLGFEDFGLQTATTRMLAVYGEWKKVEDDKKKPAAPPEETTGTAEPEPPKGRSEDPAYSAESLAVTSVNIDALCEYLLLNRATYRTILWSKLGPEDRINYLAAFGAVNRFVSPNVLGFVGDNLAVEVHALDQLEFSEWLRKHLANWKGPSADTRDVQLPVPGMTMQTRVDGCDALEPYLLRSRELELQRLDAVARQEGQEAERLAERIKKGLLDDPSPPSNVIKVEMKAPDEA